MSDDSPAVSPSVCETSAAIASRRPRRDRSPRCWTARLDREIQIPIASTEEAGLVPEDGVAHHMHNRGTTLGLSVHIFGR